MSCDERYAFPLAVTIVSVLRSTTSNWFKSLAQTPQTELPALEPVGISGSH
jgi:hypothetical protein